MSEKQLKKIRIDVVSVPFSGHINPLFQLLSLIQDDNRYDIRFITGMNKIETAKLCGFRTYGLFPDDPNKMEDIANTSGQTNLVETYKQLKQNIGLFDDAMDILVHEFKENKTDLVICDSITIPGGLAADRLNIPWITTMATPFVIETLKGIPGYVGGFKPHNGLFYKVRDSVSRKLVRLVKFSIFSFVRHLLPQDLKTFKLYRENKREAIYSNYSILGFGISEFEFINDLPEHYKFAGMLGDSPEKMNFKLQTNDERKTVLLSIGTHLYWGKDNLIELGKNLAAVHPNFDFIVTLGDALHKSNEPILFEDNLRVYAYVPYTDVMDQVDYMIHHGGAGVLYNCILNNVPSLVVPHDYDQFDFAARATYFDVALSSKNNERDILKAFNTLIHRDDWTSLKKMGELASNYDTKRILVEEIERLVNGEKK